jgi:hypothetical protein
MRLYWFESSMTQLLCRNRLAILRTDGALPTSNGGSGRLILVTVSYETVIGLSRKGYSVMCIDLVRIVKASTLES